MEIEVAACVAPLLIADVDEDPRVVKVVPALVGPELAVSARRVSDEIGLGARAGVVAIDLKEHVVVAAHTNKENTNERGSV